jgi:hypothetical protein
MPNGWQKALRGQTGRYSRRRPPEQSRAARLVHDCGRTLRGETRFEQALGFADGISPDQLQKFVPGLILCAEGPSMNWSPQVFCFSTSHHHAQMTVSITTATPCASTFRFSVSAI